MVNRLEPRGYIEGVKFRSPAILEEGEWISLSDDLGIKQDGPHYEFLKLLFEAKGKILTFQNDKDLKGFQMAGGGQQYLNCLFKQKKLLFYIVLRKKRMKNREVTLQCQLRRVKRTQE